MNLFMINEEVIFDANANELQSLKDKLAIVSLNAPTARCLQLLLESKGRVISREQFLAEVWNARGVVVSQNTFYQNISLLRKSLEQAGLSKDIIITVRKRGFILAPDVEISTYLNVAERSNDKPLNEQINKFLIEKKTDPVDEGLLAHKHKCFRKRRVLNIPIWILLILIVMTGVNMILLYFNVIL